jgi:hypothetical protein
VPEFLLLILKHGDGRRTLPRANGPTPSDQTRDHTRRRGGQDATLQLWSWSTRTKPPVAAFCIDTAGAKEALRLGLVAASTTEPEAIISVFCQRQQ